MVKADGHAHVHSVIGVADGPGVPGHVVKPRHEHCYDILLGVVVQVGTADVTKVGTRK
jgi:hypothetical protein